MDTRELCQIDTLTAEIGGCLLPRRRSPLASRLDLRLSEGLCLREGLAGSTRALLVRQLLRALGFDEHRHLRWRMEHKLVQALVFRHYFPASLPRTYGFDRLTHALGTAGLRRILPAQFHTGFVITQKEPTKWFLP